MKFHHTLHALPEYDRMRILKMRRTIPIQHQPHFDKLFDDDRLQRLESASDFPESTEWLVISSLIGIEKELEELRDAINMKGK